jgi:hypothetical protein
VLLRTLALTVTGTDNVVRYRDNTRPRMIALDLRQSGMVYDRRRAAHGAVESSVEVEVEKLLFRLLWLAKGHTRPRHGTRTCHQTQWS